MLLIRARSGTELAAGLLQLKPDLVPVGRFGTPEEIAAVALLLVRNGYITGQTININGGDTLADCMTRQGLSSVHCICNSR